MYISVTLSLFKQSNSVYTDEFNLTFFLSLGTIPSHLLNRNGSRSNSPLPNHQPTPTAMVGGVHLGQMVPMGIDETESVPQDLPPPPPTPDPVPTRSISPPCNIPPPPPPPPPPPITNGPAMPNNMPMTNGDIAKMIASNPPKLKPLKSIVDGQLRKPGNPNMPAPVDPRNDLLKAIRDGELITRLIDYYYIKEFDLINRFHVYLQV